MSFRRLLAFLLLAAAPGFATADEKLYPETANVVNVKAPPYSAKGDGKTDDTDALQAALNENVGQHRVIYFPRGTYLISRTLTWPKRWAGRDNWGKTTLHGVNRDRCVLQLKANIFTDPKKPEAIMWCGGFGSADWFHNRIENLTFNIGAGNPGAIALQFYSNNTGAVRNCRFLSHPDTPGAIGLDLGHRDMNGPLLIKDCLVSGFRRGVASARAVNSQVVENLRLTNQTEAGFDNAGQPISIRGLRYEGSAPAIRTYGSLLLVGAYLEGSGVAAKAPAIINYNGGRVFLRDVETRGYKRALADITSPDKARACRIEGEDKLGSLGPNLTEYCSAPVTTVFPSPHGSLRLPVQETPPRKWDPPQSWKIVEGSPDDLTRKKDDHADAIQQAIDSGATTVFLPAKHYQTSRTIIVRGKVQRVLGISGYLNYGKRERPDFRIEDGDAAAVTLECFSGLHGGIQIATKRTVVLRSLETKSLSPTPAAEGGRVFLEDVVGDDFQFRKQRVWARQLNIENLGTHLTNDGGDLWVLGYKTERGGTLVHTLNGGRSEILGGFSYTTKSGKLAPMFVNADSSVWAFLGEICYTGEPYETIVEETRGGETRKVSREQGNAAPYSGRAQ